MAFAKGISGNINGRKQGVLNKKTVDSLSRAQKLIEMIEAHPRWKAILDNLTDREMKDWHSELLEYLESKRTRLEVTDGNGEPLVLTVQFMPPPPGIVPPVIEEATFIEIKSLPEGAKKPF